MNEVPGRGLYPGPHQPHRCNKTVYGNAVWQSLQPAQYWHAVRSKEDNTVTGIGPKAQGKSVMRLGLIGSLLRRC